MSKVFFTSDLHLGDNRYPAYRNEYIVERLLFETTKRDTLWILGDAVVHKNGLPYFERLAQHTQVNLVLGNHDLKPKLLAPLCNRVEGFVKYKGYWLSHCPIHPEHMRDAKGNIHGHLHGESVGHPRYFNVNIDHMENGHKVLTIQFIEIEEFMEGRK